MNQSLGDESSAHLGELLCFLCGLQSIRPLEPPRTQRISQRTQSFMSNQNETADVE